MAYPKRGNRPLWARGFEALSPEYGEEIWDQIRIHDDGRIGYGGTRTFGIGGLGSGKTTLNTKIARMSYYIDGISKKDFIRSFKDADDSDSWAKEFGKLIKPETVIWRGREFDTWNILAPQNLKKYYPDDIAKPLRVHIHKDSGMGFYEGDIKNEPLPIKDLDVKEYRNVGELYKNIVDSGNNIIYPPLQHYLSLRLKESLNTKRNASPEKNKRGYTDKKYLAPDKDYLVERDMFLFELFEYIYRLNLSDVNRKWYTAIIDESHDLFRANTSDVYWWIIDYMTDVLVDSRKHNISLACMAHDTGMIDYRILGRASHFIWMRGSHPEPKYSQIDVRLIKKLKEGQAVPESRMDGKIGGLVFDKLPEGAPHMTVEGMADRKAMAVEISRDEYVAITTEDDGE